MSDGKKQDIFILSWFNFTITKTMYPTKSSAQVKLNCQMLEINECPIYCPSLSNDCSSIPSLLVFAPARMVQPDGQHSKTQRAIWKVDHQPPSQLPPLPQLPQPLLSLYPPLIHTVSLLSLYSLSFSPYLQLVAEEGVTLGIQKPSRSF